MAVRTAPSSWQQLLLCLHEKDGLPADMASLHDSLQMGKGSPEELLGVNPEDVPCYVAETQPGDLVCFDVILRTCFLLRFVCRP